MEWQRDEGSDAVFQVHQRLSEGGALPHFPVSFADGILDTPMPRQWSPGPQWARLASSVVADSEDKIHAGRTCRGKLLPCFGPQAFDRVVGLVQRLNRQRVDLALRVAAGRERVEAAIANTPQGAFRQYRSRRIARA